MDETLYQNLNTAIGRFLKPKIKNSGIVRVTHGAQFSRKGAVFGWFLLMFFLIVGVLMFVQGFLLNGILIFFLCGILVTYILDYKGIEFDFKNGKVRKYNSYMGFRSGCWYFLKNFNYLKIYEDSILEKRALNRGTTYGSFNSYDTHRFYSLFLINDIEDCFIKLYENESVTRVKILAVNFAEISGLEYIEKIERRRPEIVR